MKQTAKRAISSILGIRVVWLAVQMSLGNLAAVYGRLAWLRSHSAVEQAHLAKEQESFAEKCRRIFLRHEVLNGPFKGMKYPALCSFGSALYPKMLGSYEWELRATLDVILRRSYNAVVDVGCAEGYYAIGLGRQFQNAKIYAYDTNHDALHQCEEMAALNDVKVITGGFCDRTLLTTLDLGDRALIVSDCEGFENELFDAAVADQLRQHDFLIETHDFILIESTRNVLSYFSRTHDCEVIESTDDIIKAYTYEFPELSEFNLSERRRVLGEGRPAIMRWVFATARQREAGQKIPRDPAWPAL